MKHSYLLALAGLVSMAASVCARAESVARPLTVSPPEFKKTTDPQTGAELTFLTTDPAKENNLYFHQRSWFSDGSVILFESARANGGLMGYLTATGELARIDGVGSPLRGSTAAGNRPAVLAVRDNNLLEISLEIVLSTNPAKAQSTVTAHERVLGALPEHGHALEVAENSDNRIVAIGGSWKAMGGNGIVLVEESTGKVKDLCKIDGALGYGGHLQWSHTDPNIMSFAARSARLWMVDAREGKPRNFYPQIEGELVTHESWWVNDQLIFCGGTHPKPTENADVKVLDLRTGVTRIIGAGAWWPGATAEALAKVNWWHADGSDDGQWVVADNWYGDLMLFEGKTTRPHLLTSGHRTYGHGEHPHVGFDRASEQVVFTSEMLGNPNICVATIPQDWREKNS